MVMDSSRIIITYGRLTFLETQSTDLGNERTAWNAVSL